MRKKLKKNSGIMKKISTICLIFVMAFALNYTLVNAICEWKGWNTLESKSYAAEGSSKKIYVFTNGGTDILNKYDENNPYVLSIGEEVVFYYQCETDEEYAALKAEYGSTVYDNDINESTKVIQRTIYDIWDDSNKRLVFGFRGSTPGTCRVVTYKKSEWGTSIETVYVKVVRPNKIYAKDSFTGEYKQNPGTISAEIGEEFEVMAVLDGNLRMNGDVPSEEAYVGSGFWSGDPISVTNEWKKLDGNKWMVTAKCKGNRVGRLKLNLAKNGTFVVDELYVNIQPQNKIKINNIKIGNQSYNDVNKNAATKMLNGKDTGNNEASNRYTVYVGNTLDISAEDASGYSFEASNTTNIKEVSTSEDGGKLVASYKGVTPGNCEINLKNSDGQIVETLYVTVKYPINVKTAISERSKDTVHEYVSTAIGWAFDASPNNFITDTSGSPLYVKNGPSATYQYFVDPGNTVVVTTYVKDGDSTTFVYSSGLEVVDESTTTEPDGFKKITAEVKVNASSGAETVKMGNETFYIGVKNADNTVNHFDFEIADEGSYTLIETTTYTDGSKKVVKTSYDAFITRIHGSEVYNKDGELIAKLEENEYWQNNSEGQTQFEGTSAYVTNEDGNLIDENGNVIDEDVRNGRRAPLVKTRDVHFADVDSVKFIADLTLKPLKRITTMVNENGEVVEENTETENISGDINQSKQIITMGKRDVLDALNKCPDHSGLDFTARILINIEHRTGNLNVSKRVENKNGDDEFSFRITLVDENGNALTDINGVYGDLEFKNGVATFKLKDGENKMILNLPSGVNYIIEEIDSKGYTVVATGATGTIESDATIYAEFVNKRETEDETEDEAKEETNRSIRTGDAVLKYFVSTILSLIVVFMIMVRTSKRGSKRSRR